MTKARSILVTYSGYPAVPSSLMPDNGLASLAGCLEAEGHNTLIIDYEIVDIIRRLVPDEYREKLGEMYPKLMSIDDKIYNLPKKLFYGIRLKYIDNKLTQHREKVAYELAEDLINIVKKEKPDFVGFKLWVGDGFDASVIIAEQLKKEFPNIKLYAGGPLVDFAKENIYKRTGVFDALSYGEGEETILGLAKHSVGKRSLKDIPNLIYKDGNEIKKTQIKRVEDLNKLPYPVYDENIYPAMKGDNKIKVIVIDESRGCPYGCGFCSHQEKSGNYWRKKTPERIVDEIEYFIDRYGIHAFRYGGSNTPFDLMVDVAEKILSKNLDVDYTSFAHVKNLDPEKLSLLKKSGLYSLFFGIESGDDRILKDVMLKGVNREQIKEALKASIAAGIFTVGSVIFPAPSETAESRKNTIDLLIEIYKDHLDMGGVPVTFPGLYPTSKWGRDPEKFGFSLNNPETYVEDMMNYKMKHMLPPQFWKELPYKVNGKSFKKFAKETEIFLKELERNGILTWVSDDTALIGHLYDPKISIREFRDLCREVLYVGDYERMGNIVGKVNKNAKRI